MKKGIFIILLWMVHSCLIAQNWQWAGSTPTNGSWFGTINNLPIDVRTNNVQRMRINSANLGNTLNGFTGQNTSGFVGISGDPTFWTAVTSPQTPVSLLHLIQ